MDTSSVTNNSLRLAGKVAIVTGGSRGIGAAISKQLASEGATVAVNYTNGAEAAEAVVAEIKKAGGEAHAFQADVASREAVFGLVDEVIRRWGHLDIFVNNAGIAGKGPASVEDVTEEEVDRLLAINYKGTLWGIQAAAKVLKSGGSIINVSSFLARAGRPNMGAYAATKAAVEIVSKTASRELGPKGIRVNAVAPGLIPTDMARGVFSPEALEQRKSLTPLENRLGTPEEVANVVSFLASGQASWVTGQTIDLAGGI